MGVSENWGYLLYFGSPYWGPPIYGHYRIEFEWAIKSLSVVCTSWYSSFCKIRVSFSQRGEVDLW